MSNARRGLGQTGEQLAARYLTAQGYQIEARNWRLTGLGEIDLVARDGDCLVIVEVRTRRGQSFGAPEESVTGRKQARLAALAEAYAAAASWNGPMRIDVVGVHLAADGRLLGINQVRDAVQD